MELNKQTTKSSAAAKAGIDEKTARKYRKLGKLPSQLSIPEPRSYRTRQDPFASVWPQAKSLLLVNLGLEAKSLYEYLQREYPGEFPDGQLRTFQRHIKNWRALEGRGKGKEVFFPQEHHPGELSASDFTHMGSLRVIIRGKKGPVRKIFWICLEFHVSRFRASDLLVIIAPPNRDVFPSFSRTR